MQGEETINMIVGELSHHSQQISSNRLSQGTYHKVPIFFSCEEAALEVHKSVSVSKQF